MAAMLMLPTYGAMASSVKKEIYEKDLVLENDFPNWGVSENEEIDGFSASSRQIQGKKRRNP